MWGQCRSSDTAAELADQLVSMLQCLSFSASANSSRGLLRSKDSCPPISTICSFASLSAPRRYVTAGEDGCSIRRLPRRLDHQCRLALPGPVPCADWKEVEKVSAVMSSRTHGEKVEDYSVVTLQAQGGVVGVVETGYSFPNTRDEQREFSFTVGSRRNYVYSGRETFNPRPVRSRERYQDASGQVGHRRLLSGLRQKGAGGVSHRSSASGRATRRRSAHENHDAAYASARLAECRRRLCIPRSESLCSQRSRQGCDVMFILQSHSARRLWLAAEA